MFLTKRSYLLTGLILTCPSRETMDRWLCCFWEIEDEKSVLWSFTQVLAESKTIAVFCNLDGSRELRFLSQIEEPPSSDSIITEWFVVNQMLSPPL